MNWLDFIIPALEEDVRGGDVTSLSCIRENAIGKARLLVKQDGVLAGMELARRIFHYLDDEITFEPLLNEGDEVHAGQVAFHLTGKAQAILTGERLALNCMQRMSGIATLTRQFVNEVSGYRAKILDTRKTTPLFRAAEKWAVKIGGGQNHRFGLYDMMLIKDNHIDYAGGIRSAIEAARSYLQHHHLNLPVEIEARNPAEVEEILSVGGVNRIMLDNFSLENLAGAVNRINGRFETEASGGVNLNTVRDMAATGVDYISVGALTHSYHSLDLSLKAEIGPG